jgi:act minimal PKS acyl carrier protein
MRRFTLDDLREILCQASGDAGTGAGDADIAHVSYAELGYDSLARLDIVARIKQGFGVEVPDDAIDAGSMPASTVTVVNRLLEPVDR